MAEQGRDSRVGARAARLAGVARDWVASGPVSTLLAAGVVALALVAAITGRDWYDALAASATTPGRVWTLVTSWFWCRTPITAVENALLLLTVGVAAERFLKARRYLTVGLVTAALGVLVLQAADPLIAGVDQPWADHLARSLAGGAGAPVMGVVAAASARLDPLWKRRTRTLLFALSATLAAFGGGADDLVRLASALVGLVIGQLAWRDEAPERSLVGTRHDARTIVSLGVFAVTLGTLVAAVSSYPVGPLAGARYALDPQSTDAATIAALCGDPATAYECARATYVARTQGIGPTVLAAMPMVVQLALADGLRLGRRSAAIGTVLLQLLVAALAFAHLAAVWWIVHLSSDSATPLGLGAHGTPSARLVTPILLPLLLAATVIATRRHFAIRIVPGTFRRLAAQALAALGVGLALVVILGLASQDEYSPEATAVVLAGDYGVRLLPSAALALLTPTLEPNTVLATIIVEWTPIAVWAIGAFALWKALRAEPATHQADRARLTDLVRRTGAGSLGWMQTWPGNDVWVSDDGRTAVGYRASSGVALTVTEPAGKTAELRAGIIGFADFATAHSLVPALYSVHAGVASLARDLGWTTVQVAEEAVIDLPGLAFTGKKFQDLRTALNRAAKEEVRAVWTTYRTCPQGVREQIAAICTAWLADKELPEMGFTLGGLAEIDDDDTRLLLAVDAEGTVQAVTSWMPIHREGTVVGLTLDVMRRREEGFRPAMEFLIARAALDAQAEGLEVLSLSGAPLARSGQVADDLDLVPSSNLLDPVLEVLGTLLEPVYGFRSLLAFKAKFAPRFVPLYLAVPDIVDAPTVGLAIARAYLPGLGAADAARFAQKLVRSE